MDKRERFRTEAYSSLFYKIQKLYADTQRAADKQSRKAYQHKFLLEINKNGYIPAYENSEIYSRLHEKFGFYNDTEIVTYEKMNKVIKK